jgi:hypothetical protein
MIAFGDGAILHVLPEPTGTFDGHQRQHMLGLYSFIHPPEEDEGSVSGVFEGLLLSVGRLLK